MQVSKKSTPEQGSKGRTNKITFEISNKQYGLKNSSQFLLSYFTPRIYNFTIKTFKDFYNQYHVTQTTLQNMHAIININIKSKN